MFELEFSEKVNNDIVSVLHYIKNTLEAPIASENHYNELVKIYGELEKNPYKRPLVQDKFLASKGIRSISVKKLFTFLYNQ